MRQHLLLSEFRFFFLLCFEFKSVAQRLYGLQVVCVCGVWCVVCVCLAVLHGLWDLGSSTRDRTQAPCSGSMEF